MVRLTRKGKTIKNYCLSMSPYSTYVNSIEKLAIKLVSSATINADNSEIQLVLDGQPMKVLREVVSIHDLKNSGAFFTNHNLANKLIKTIIPDLKKGILIGDPACGAGNLLVSCANHLPILNNLSETLTLWGDHLFGIDLYPEFIKATKTRLLLLAIQRGAKGVLSDVNISELFPNIRISDYLSQSKLNVNCIVVNPPYSIVEAPYKCDWASGSISKAALFIEKCVTTSDPGTRIVALLPDVLRTGSRYSKWREKISRFAKIESIEIFGQFDKFTDIDVFLLRMITTNSSNEKANIKWWNFSENVEVHKSIISDYFNVQVGPVVPYRDPHRGKWFPYIHARLLPSWTTINTDNGFKKRRYFSTTYEPPFVVVRRTSRPGDSHRAIGAIIVGKQSVAVENHLIILKPISGRLTDCEQLLGYLRSDMVTDWLNKRIRCRHLTVSSIKELPFEGCR